MDGRPKRKVETINLLEENIGENFMTLNLALISWMVLNVQATEEKDKLNFLKIKNFSSSEAISNKVQKATSKNRKCLQIRVFIEIGIQIKNFYHPAKTNQ